ncbi:MAG: haloacid dehalogenase-like hydrolase [Alistipes sp.]|nr:haloacid dehalogenase-like hydrolase [Alistipes sp.]MBR0394780.1 haloacid dehalogenase-like hydrolase [Alistipes sp.]
MSDSKKQQFTVALIYDFDGTLAAGNMQEYDFIPAVGKSNKEFWSDANKMAEEQDADQILTYMALMIREAQAKGLSLRREAFQESGRKVVLYPGVEEWFERINSYGESQGVKILHYINSSGLKEIIEGTTIADRFQKIYACSFLYNVDGIAYWPGVAVNYTNKTQFIFKINKGVESVYDTKLVNRYMEEKSRPVPFSRMIYVGDGTTDIPCMRLVKNFGGHSIAVYNPKDKGRRNEMNTLIRDNRVNHVCPADYSDGSEMDTVVKAIIDKCVSDYRLEKLETEKL